MVWEIIGSVIIVVVAALLTGLLLEGIKWFIIFTLDLKEPKGDDK